MTELACLGCEGRGTNREYLDRAGSFTVHHCKKCGGTGKEAAEITYARQAARGAERERIANLCTKSYKALGFLFQVPCGKPNGHEGKCGGRYDA